MLYKSIIIYFIIVLVYFRFQKIENNKWEKFLLAIFIPFIGFIAVVLSNNIKIVKYIEKTKEKKDIDKEKSKEYLTKIQSSLIDDLTIQNYKTAREMILSIKSLSLEEQCKICNIAIRSKNVEIAHIAAVSLMKIKNYFEKFFAHMESKVDLTKIENQKKYIDGIYKYLNCELIHGALQERYLDKIVKLIEKLILEEEKCEKKYYIILIKCCILINDYEKAINNIKGLIEIYEIDDEMYMLILEIYIKTRQVDKIHELKKQIKLNSKIVKSKKLISILEMLEGCRNEKI